ncbi:MAG: TetR/AcrR family transcriptional regulator [Tumebacillaceae bacterium]
MVIQLVCNKEESFLTFQHFLNLPEEKQREIFEASLEEFVTHGYDLASTNRIVERAGISKGVLFKYFSNKESLFQYVAEQSLAILSQSWQVTPEEMPDDFFAGFRLIAANELRLMEQHPQVFALFDKIAGQQQHPVYQNVLAGFQEQAHTMYRQLFSALSTKKLRDDIPLERALAMVQWVVEGFKRQYLLTYQESGVENLATIGEQAMQELEFYFDLLKMGLYKRD